MSEAGPDGLASGLMKKGALTSDWLPAFKAVSRHVFVPDVIWPGRAGMNRQDDRVIRSETPESWWEAVWTDAPITTQWDDGKYTGPGRGRTPSCSNSNPTMVFSMLAALDVEAGHRVLEIGTGTGWNAALLCHRLGDMNVVTVEVDAQIAATARARLMAADFHPKVIVGDGTRGYGQDAPYDRIIATCSVGSIPGQWTGQAKPGSVIVAPWGPLYGGEALAKLTVTEAGTLTGRFVGSSAFMRLREQRKSLPPTSDFVDEALWPAGGVESRTTLSPDDVGGWIHMFAIGVQVPDMFCRVSDVEEDSYRLWLFDRGRTSWASADYVRGEAAFRVVQSGRRDLWHELETAWLWWDRQGRPGFDRFGLTVDHRGHVVWLDAPGNPVPLRSSGSRVRKPW
ncbi:methyltransferase domain-containing protein [Streptomyces glycanivorans]|uniref:Protein-L-isoaspartate O-methyltransferase n=2 Tax=Streptomyces glycanivorans TaxID=3033808 RepID=A0ABY9JMD7_9ACTN|nr:methyltransferase domain-containing protein [Streptomyces sp. Alt3]WLQ68901.1 methyltransferase domain-containing protein [Streptomyces sp. Alt3]